MSEKRFTREYPPFRDEFGCVNNLLNGDSYPCANSSVTGERDAIGTAIEICNVFNELYFEKQELEELNKELQAENNSLKRQMDNSKAEIKYLTEELKEQEGRKWACLKQAHLLDLKIEKLEKNNKNYMEEIKALKQKN